MSFSSGSAGGRRQSEPGAHFHLPGDEQDPGERSLRLNVLRENAEEDEEDTPPGSQRPSMQPSRNHSPEQGDSSTRPSIEPGVVFESRKSGGGTQSIGLQSHGKPKLPRSTTSPNMRLGVNTDSPRTRRSFRGDADFSPKSKNKRASQEDDKRASNRTSRGAKLYRQETIAKSRESVNIDKAKDGTDLAEALNVSPVALDEMRDVFSLFDQDGSGSIDPKEIRTQMSILGFEADNTTIYQLISDLDTDGSQKLEFEEFAALMSQHLGSYTAEYTSRRNCSEIFDYLDDLDPKKRDGMIDVANLRRLAQVLGDKIEDSELETMIKGADRDGKGHVTSEDFYELMVGCDTQMRNEEELRKQRDALTEFSSSRAGVQDLAARRKSLAVKQNSMVMHRPNFKRGTTTSERQAS